MVRRIFSLTPIFQDPKNQAEEPAAVRVTQLPERTGIASGHSLQACHVCTHLVGRLRLKRQPRTVAYDLAKSAGVRHP